ncbi:hypothetical protein Tco_0667148 [Tanacetum coccineum]
MFPLLISLLAAPNWRSKGVFKRFIMVVLPVIEPTIGSTKELMTKFSFPDENRNKASRPPFPPPTTLEDKLKHPTQDVLGYGSRLAQIRRRHIDLESHQRDLQLEVCRERYSRLKLLFQNLEILFKVDFDLGFKGLRLSSFARVLGFIKASNDDTSVAQRRLEDKQPEKKTNTDCLVEEQEKVHLGIKVGENITITRVPGQEGAEGNVVEKKKVKESMKANLRKLLKYKAWIVIMEYLVKVSKRRAFWSLNEDILKITILKTNTPYPSRKIRRAGMDHKKPGFELEGSKMEETAAAALGSKKDDVAHPRSKEWW